MIYSDASHPVQVKMCIEKASALRSLCAHIFLKSVQNLEHFSREYRPLASGAGENNFVTR